MCIFTHPNYIAIRLEELSLSKVKSVSETLKDAKPHSMSEIDLTLQYIRGKK